jgi:hypothetical protein
MKGECYTGRLHLHRAGSECSGSPDSHGPQQSRVARDQLKVSALGGDSLKKMKKLDGSQRTLLALLHTTNQEIRTGRSD